MSLNIVRQREFDSKLITKLFEAIGENETIGNAKFFLDENNILLIAYLRDDIAGFLYGYILESPSHEKPLMFLYSIDVFPRFVFTNDANHKAKKLYETAGRKRINLDDVMYEYELES